MATWVVGDIHGCYDDFMKLLKNSEIKENDTIILIGDIIDRGPQSAQMLHWAYKNVTENGKYQMILGNHEDMVISDFIYATRVLNEHPELSLRHICISQMSCTYGFDEYIREDGFETLYSIEPYINWMNHLPLYKQITVNDTKYHIAHAWWYPNISRNDILWYREKDYCYKPIIDEPNTYLIHGHTPTIGIPKCKMKPVNEVLMDGFEINIDCGCVFKMYGGNLAAIRLEDQKVIYANPQEKISYEGD